MTIFEALRQSHEIQRALCVELLATQGDSPERHELFGRLKQELAAHAMAEERHFYVPLLQADLTQALSRHAIAEHHEMDEQVESLEQTDPSSSSWLAQAKKLSEKVHHHLEEEEHSFFQMAGKVLAAQQKLLLAGDYLEEYRAYLNQA
jgi:hypothetical protein